MTEAELREIWARQLVDGASLVDSAGRHLQVVYPGRRPGGPGPDFQGALISLGDGTLLRGDVEVHLSARSWWVHGHHRDPRYNRTILHVALQGGRGTDAVREDGSSIPTLVLSGRLRLPGAGLRRALARATPLPGMEPCLASDQAVLRRVEAAGLQRFLDKAARFEADLSVVPADIVLLRGVLVALGYSANRQACARLAERLSWDGLAAAGEQEGRARLLGAAGLLPSQRGISELASPGLLSGDREEPQQLERFWAAIAARDAISPLPDGAWCFSGVRPEGFPTRRLAGGARLLSGWAGRSPAEDLADALLSCRRPAELDEMFRVTGMDGYWAWHYDFGVPTPGRRPWLIGRPRAGEIVVNVALPFCYALGSHLDRPELADRALGVFRSHPSTGWNRISLHMAAQLLGSRGRRLNATAARQQGLLHLFNQWCWERRCEACPAGERRRRAARRTARGEGRRAPSYEQLETRSANLLPFGMRAGGLWV